MKTTFSFKLVLCSILLLILLYPISCYGQVTGKRLSGYTSSSSGGGLHAYSSNATNKTYYYSDNNPELIDSIYTLHTIHEWNEHYGDTVIRDSSTVYYSGTLSWENGLKHIQYLTSQNNIIDIFRDNQNRISIYNNPGDNQIIRFYYTAFGKLDSLYAQYSSSTKSYKIHYDNQNLISFIHSNYYLAPDIQITYPGTLVPYGTNLNFNEELQYCLNVDLIRIAIIFDPVYPINSFYMPELTYDWVYPSYNYESEIQYSYFSYNYAYDIHFEPDGYLSSFSVCYSPSSSTHESRGYHFTWESITPNDDPVAPAPSNVLHVYPNPFRDYVKIEMQDASMSTSEVAIYNIKGQLVKKWEGMKSNEVLWDGKDITNHSISSGVYLVKVKHNGTSLTSKIVKIQ